jgi:DNA-binding transcriptional LysR family regulator
MTTGSISGAARLLIVSQPAVSRLLSYTESRVGFTLFERVKGRLYPTQEAKKLFREVEQVYLGVQKVNSLAHELAERSEGAVHIVSSQSIGQMLIPRAITRFRQSHPNVKCRFENLNYIQLRESLVSQRADLGVVILPMDHPNLHVTPLCSGRLVCICPYNHPLTRRSTLLLSDLLPFPLISYDRETPFGAMVAHMYEQAELPMRVDIEVGSPQNACALVQTGAGVALVDEFSVRSWPQSQLVVRSVSNACTVVANLVHSRFEPLSGPAQAFASGLRDLMHEQGFPVTS